MHDLPQAAATYDENNQYMEENGELNGEGVLYQDDRGADDPNDEAG